VTLRDTSATLSGVPLPDPIRAFLAEPRVAAIATLNPDGSPHQAVVWYVLDGESLMINSRRERRWPQNLARDGRISVAVHEGTQRSHWVGVKGHAELLHEGDEALADIQALARRYGGDPRTFVGQERVSYRIVVASTFEYGADE
jgi:PPOX class probable F420-dependent enzyme